MFSYEKINHNLDYKKSWVSFYFNNPQSISEGVTVENHLGQKTIFQTCLLPDDPDFIEPGEVNCKNKKVTKSQTLNIDAGIKEKWTFDVPDIPGKYWILAEYMENGQDTVKYLSFVKK